jgi:exodeoxyribonuclease VII small subunit
LSWSCVESQPRLDRQKAKPKPVRANKPSKPGKEATLPATNADITAMSFEDALKELEQIVDKLEKGSVGLEESIAIYARGEALKTHCNDLLRNAEQRIEKISLGADGRPSGTEPLDVE